MLGPRHGIAYILSRQLDTAQRARAGGNRPPPARMPRSDRAGTGVARQVRASRGRLHGVPHSIGVKR
mgnify:CR=1 FL=1